MPEHPNRMDDEISDCKEQQSDLIVSRVFKYAGACVMYIFNMMKNFISQQWVEEDSYLRFFIGRLFNFSIWKRKSRITNKIINRPVPEKWLRAQADLKRKIILHNTEPWQELRLSDQMECISDEENCGNQSLRYVAGVDLSYMKDSDQACAAIVVCKLPDLKVVYEDYQMEKITVPYIAGFLTFREVLPFLEAVRKLLIVAPNLKPQVILVDGNGILHPRGAGLACHLGVLADIPCIGVAKNLLLVGDIIKDKLQIKSLFKSDRDEYPLTTTEGNVIGMAVKTTKSSTNPVYVSIGHKIDLETAVWVVRLCSKYRVPEPIRQADIRSREFLREHYPDLMKDSNPKEE